MQLVLLIIAAALSIALYRMLSKGGKTYAYGHTQTISFLSDGSEQVHHGTETGSIIMTTKTVLIDGLEFSYKPVEGEPLQAILEYDETGLRSVKIFVPDGEKQYFIDRAQSTRNQPASFAS